MRGCTALIEAAWPARTGSAAPWAIGAASRASWAGGGWARRPGARREATVRLKLTTVGAALRTPTYTAPEHASPDPGLHHRVHIDALGVVAYELLAGRPPFTGHTAQEVLAAHMTRPPEPIRNFRGNVA